MKIIHFDKIDSTQNYAKEAVRHADGILNEQLLVTAEEQSAGRGRTGKSFTSLRNNGLYMTTAFPVNRKPEDSLFITVAAAVAVCEVLREAGCPEAKIKWVNDIYVKDRKVCGILTEAVTDPETGLMQCALVGIGVNIDADFTEFPEELKAKVGTVHNLSLKKEELAVVIAERVRRLAAETMESAAARVEVLQKYREMSMILGREIYWEENGSIVRGIAADIDEEARLVAETKEGGRILDSGYISIRF